MACIYSKQFSYDLINFSYIRKVIELSDLDSFARFDKMSDNFGYFSPSGYRASNQTLSVFIGNKIVCILEDKSRDTQHEFTLSGNLSNDIKVLNNAFSEFKAKVASSKKKQVGPNTFVDFNSNIKRKGNMACIYSKSKNLKQFASTFGSPQPINIYGRKYYILGYNNKEYAIQNEQGKNILGDLKVQGVDWNSIVYWLRKQGANTSKAEALKKCVDERTTEKGIIQL